MEIYKYIERILIIIVTPIFCITYMIMKNIIQVNQLIHIYNNSYITQEGNMVITTKKGQGK